MKATHYAEALYRASLGKTEAECATLLERLVALLRKNGHERLGARILHELARLVRVRENARGVFVRVAQAGDVLVHQERIHADVRRLGGEGPMHTICDDTLVGGYEVRVGGTSVDRTHKRTLLALYQQFITR
jgi:F0F1-type ATP synthase delta subunit